MAIDAAPHPNVANSIEKRCTVVEKKTKNKKTQKHVTKKTPKDAKRIGKHWGLCWGGSGMIIKCNFHNYHHFSVIHKWLIDGCFPPHHPWSSGCPQPP